MHGHFSIAATKASWRAELLRLSLKAVKNFGSRRENSIAEVRRRLKKIERIVPRAPAGNERMVLSADGIRIVQIKVRQARSDRYILHFHGGGYAFGSETLYRDFTWRVGSATQASVLYFDYALAPEHPFPAAVNDASTVYRWLLSRVDPTRIVFLGDSAGGGLALGTACKLRDEGVPLPGAIVAISPWTDLALTGQSLRLHAHADPMMNVARFPGYADQYLAGADPRHPYASPLYGDASGLPPVLIQVGSDEVLRDDGVRMAAKLRAGGCDVAIEVWPRMPHAWHLYARILPEGRQAIARIGEFLQTKF
jgi:epsilon-lactone hydrolase